MKVNRALKAITAVYGLFTISMYSMKRQKTMLTDRVEISNQTRKEVLFQNCLSGQLFEGLPRARV